MNRFLGVRKLQALMDLLEQIPEGPQFAHDQREQLEGWVELSFDDGSSKEIYLDRVRNLASQWDARIGR